MQEGENITQYTFRIKEVVSAIEGVGGTMIADDVVRKIIINLLPIYYVRIFAIQELTSIPSNAIILDALICKMTTFELNNYYNSLPKIETYFKISLTIGSSRKEKERDIHHSSYGSGYDYILLKEKE